MTHPPTIIDFLLIESILTAKTITRPEAEKLFKKQKQWAPEQDSSIPGQKMKPLELSRFYEILIGFGILIPKENELCPKCKKIIPDLPGFCVHCGHPLRS